MRDDVVHDAADASSATIAARRAVLRCGGLAAVLVGCGLGVFGDAIAAVDPLFDATLTADVLRGLGAMPIATTLIDLEVPELTENGAVVPIAVTSRLPNTEQIFIVAEKNPFPLVARFDVAPGTEPYISTRVKLAESGSVCAIVKAGGRLYAVSRDTAVTLGGCGG